MFDVPRLPPRLIFQADEWLEVKRQVEANSTAQQNDALRSALSL